VRTARGWRTERRTGAEPRGNGGDGGLERTFLSAAPDLPWRAGARIAEPRGDGGLVRTVRGWRTGADLSWSSRATRRTGAAGMAGLVFPSLEQSRGRRTGAAGARERAGDCRQNRAPKSVNVYTIFL
jgi:hypothetical protein